jgi:hypothetical protein
MLARPPILARALIPVQAPCQRVKFSSVRGIFDGAECYRRHNLSKRLSAEFCKALIRSSDQEIEPIKRSNFVQECDYRNLFRFFPSHAVSGR